MAKRWAKWYQDYQDGHDFPGRILFGAATRLVAMGYHLGYFVRRSFSGPLGRNAYRPRARVIGVGNLTVGGSGKTSLVHYIASRLLQSGRRVTILTRGYGRKENERKIIEPGQAEQTSVDSVGDEPLMLARRLPRATIIVDPDRAGAAFDFERQSETQVFILDDAHQYHRIAYDRRILCFLAGDVSLPQRLFPAGRWREPLAAVARADAAVFITDYHAYGAEEESQKLHKFGFTGPTFTFSYQLASWCYVAGTPAGFLSVPGDSTIGVFCALARPEQFFRWLNTRHITPVRTWRFADHYPYRQRDIDCLCAKARAEAIDYLITTEKDAVKLARFDTGEMRIIYPEVRLEPVSAGDEFDRFLESVFDHEARL